MIGILRTIFICPLGLCPHAPMSDDTGCWGECIHCGSRAGFVDRATLRAYADAGIEAHLRSRAKQEAAE